MSIIKMDSGLPIRSELMAWAEFVEITGVRPDRLEELVDMGWVEPGQVAGEQRLFRNLDIYRVRKLERICCDFELPAVGGTIIVDLLERIDMLERSLRQRTS